MGKIFYKNIDGSMITYQFDRKNEYTGEFICFVSMDMGNTVMETSICEATFKTLHKTQADANVEYYNKMVERTLYDIKIIEDNISMLQFDIAHKYDRLKDYKNLLIKNEIDGLYEL